jgi:spore coat polysaccharide biosynthesis protein SpsF
MDCVVSENLTIAAILQARMGSARFPGKVLANINGKPLVMHIVERIQATKKISTIILATTELPIDDELVEFAKKKRINYYRGEENNVLARFYGAATQYKADVIVRVCCDDPLIDHRILDELINLHLRTESDYTSTSHERTYPIGVEAEVFNYNALEKSLNNAKKDYELEHVTPYIYEHPELFKIMFLEASGELRRPDLRLTVDTAEDLKFVKEIFKNLYKEGQLFHTKDVIQFIDSHPEILSINAHVTQKELGK